MKDLKTLKTCSAVILIISRKLPTPIQIFVFCKVLAFFYVLITEHIGSKQISCKNRILTIEISEQILAERLIVHKFESFNTKKSFVHF